MANREQVIMWVNDEPVDSGYMRFEPRSGLSFATPSVAEQNCECH